MDLTASVGVTDLIVGGCCLIYSKNFTCPSPMPLFTVLTTTLRIPVGDGVEVSDVSIACETNDARDANSTVLVRAKKYIVNCGAHSARERYRKIFQIYVCSDDGGQKTDVLFSASKVRSKIPLRDTWQTVSQQRMGSRRL